MILKAFQPALAAQLGSIATPYQRLALRLFGPSATVSYTHLTLPTIYSV